MKMQHFGEMTRHLQIHKFSSTYLRWIHHGEPSDVVIIEDPPHNDGNGGDEDDNAGHGNHNMDMDVEGEADGEAKELEAMLRDLTGAAACKETDAESKGGYDKVLEIFWKSQSTRFTREIKNSVCLHY